MRSTNCTNVRKWKGIKMQNNKFIIRFTDVATQPSHKNDSQSDGDSIKRLIGFVKCKNLFPLFNNLGLESNPRSSKRNNVVADILETLTNTPELFHYKSKGILLGTSNYKELDRKRFQLEFENRSIEGILDGGHNMLAIGLHILANYIDEKNWRKIKSWTDLKEQWENYRNEIEADKDDDEFNFLVPVELLIPAGDEISFTDSLIEICSARNNNAQLTLEAKSNKQGFYDAIKEHMHVNFANRVEWKPNVWVDQTEKRPIKVRDLVALSWIPLNKLQEAEVIADKFYVSPITLYSSKGEASKRFDDLMGNEKITEDAKDGSGKRVLIHEGVASAFKILADLPHLYDRIYKNFPDAYNKNDKRFGSNPIVRVYNPTQRAEAKQAKRDYTGWIATKPKTPFYRDSTKYDYPDGLIMPIIYGLSALMEVKDGQVQWMVDSPADFLDKNLAEIVRTYDIILDQQKTGKWDTKKISRAKSSYDYAVQQFETALLRMQIKSGDKV